LSSRRKYRLLEGMPQQKRGHILIGWHISVSLADVLPQTPQTKEGLSVFDLQKWCRFSKTPPQ